MKKKIVLIGMRGCGKSHFSSCLAQLLKWPKLDMDDEIEDEMGMTIPAIIEKFGWEKFREKEHKMAKKMASLTDIVIATGGGAITFERNRELLTKDALVVFLFVPFDILVDRLSSSDNDRPDLEKGVGVDVEIRKTWEERSNIYFETADIVFQAKPDLDEHKRINVEKNAAVLYRKIKGLVG